MTTNTIQPVPPGQLDKVELTSNYGLVALRSRSSDAYRLQTPQPHGIEPYLTVSTVPGRRAR
jgi:hypothetical protein